jgi:hypothetical protein
MFNNMMDSLSEVPTLLAAGWAVWFGAGALLVMWYRKAKADAEMQPAMVSRAVTRAKSGPRPTAEPRSFTEPRPVEPRPVAEPRPATDARPAVTVARPKPSPIVVGDPFGDLATLLDQPTDLAPASAPSSRVPGDSPILNSAGSPVRRSNDPEPNY